MYLISKRSDSKAPYHRSFIVLALKTLKEEKFVLDSLDFEITRKSYQFVKVDVGSKRFHRVGQLGISYLPPQLLFLVFWNWNEIQPARARLNDGRCGWWYAMAPSIHLAVFCFRPWCRLVFSCRPNIYVKLGAEERYSKSCIIYFCT